MANEKRLIDANALKARLGDLEASGGHKYYRQGMDDVLHKFMPKILDDVPTVDAVEVVRCKDCEYFRVEPDDFLGVCKCGAIATNYGGEIYPEREHFCSYGERREGE